MDQNIPYKIAVCPFNVNHKTIPERLIFHLSKCKDAQENKNGLVHCPYNFAHAMKLEDLQQHLSDCQSKIEYSKLTEYQNENNVQSLQKEFQNHNFCNENDIDFWNKQKSAWSNQTDVIHEIEEQQLSQ